MRFLEKAKDGGPESRVWAYILFEIKGLFSIMLLNFEDGSREAYHSHAFNAVSWLLKGILKEYRIDKKQENIYKPSVRPIFTTRQNTHKVVSVGDSWALTFRGPWTKTWSEQAEGYKKTLTHGRVEVQKESLF